MVNNTHISSSDEDIFIKNATTILQTYRLKIGNGEIVKISELERILTHRGYILPNKLQYDDVIATPRTQPLTTIFNTLEERFGRDTEVSYLLGQLVGDGDVGESSEISTGLCVNHTKLWNWLDRINLLKTERTKESSWGDQPVHYIRLFSDIRVNSTGKTHRKTLWHKFLEQCDMKHDCYNKIVPRQVLFGTNEVRSAFLAGLWDADGCITVDAAGYCRAHLASASPKLINHITRLLRHFSIPYTICPQHSYLVVLDTISFKRIISPFLILKTFNGKLLDGSEHGAYPRQEVFDKIKQCNNSVNAFCKQRGISRIAKGGKRVTPFVTERIARICGVVNSENRFHRVIECEKIGFESHCIHYEELVGNGTFLKGNL